MPKIKVGRTELVWPGKYDEEEPDRERKTGVET